MRTIKLSQPKDDELSESKSKKWWSFKKWWKNGGLFFVLNKNGFTISRKALILLVELKRIELLAS